jgi:hypothetical protein
MKIWYGFGSEHSSNLVMIGCFDDAGDAAKAMNVIERITDQVKVEVDTGLITVGGKTERFSSDMLNILSELNMPVIGTVELEQFAYEATIRVKGNQIVLKTEEIDVSAFMKILVMMGARVEVYSAHDHPDTGYGRGK